MALPMEVPLRLARQINPTAKVAAVEEELAGPEAQEDLVALAALADRGAETQVATNGGTGKGARKAAKGAVEEAPVAVDPEAAAQEVEVAQADGLMVQVGVITTPMTPLIGQASWCKG